MGDYDVIAGGANSFSSSWSDNRLATEGNWGQPDVYFAQIDLPRTTADLAVGVTASPASVNLGQTVNFTVTAAATGGTANDVFISVPSAPGLAIQSITTGSGECTNVDGFAGCSMGSIAAGTSKSVQIVAMAVVAAGTRTLSAQGTTSSADANAANNSGSFSIPVSTGSAVTTVHSTGNIAVPILIANTIEVPVKFPDTGNVVGITARVRLNHTFDRDLQLSLIAPTGQVVVLSSFRGGSGDNYGSDANDCTGTPTRFNDNRPTRIDTGTPPFAGAFKPDQPLLSVLAGVPSNGVWQLRVGNNSGNHTSGVGCVSLAILRVP
ncbi:MAG: proprotein convertase P-domain-containing protein [Pseudomonadota bacterium]|nr:proprotein convertase P-domain-containing protein [Pseudomonadota bacterium]